MTRRAVEILQRLPSGYVIGAEIGVFHGKTSAKLLQRNDLMLFMVDHWRGFSADGKVIANDKQQEINLKTAIEKTEFAKDRRNIMRKESSEAAKEIDANSLDFVFIDANHSYESVLDDIRHWMPKLKLGGLLCGHDYANHEIEQGNEVKKAVDEVVKFYGWILELAPDFTWFCRV